MREREVQILRAAALATAIAAATVASGSAAAAAETCALPASLGFTAEQVAGPAGGEPRVVVLSRAAGQDSIAPGDVVRQVNGVRVAGCDDLERAVRDAAHSGLVVLVAVERGGRLLALAASAEPERRAPAVAIAPPPVAAGSPGAPGAPSSESAAVPGPAPAPQVAAPAPAPAPLPKPAIAARPDPLAGLPSDSSAAPGARESATAAARILSSIEAVAKLGVPLPLYDARVRGAESELARVVGGSAGPTAGVRAAVDGILEYYRVAGDVRRAKQEWVEDKGSEGAVRAVNIPYLSTSRVPRWLAEYPFLREAVGSEPEATNFLVPGESSGTWSPDRAAEILWERAREDTADLQAWGTGAGG